MRLFILKSEVKSELKEFWISFSQNRGAVLSLCVLGVFLFLAIFSAWIAPHAPSVVDTEALRLPPVWSSGGMGRYFLGTDDVGRDVLSRLIYGARVSLGVGFLVVLLATSVGSFLGLLAGYFGGWLDQLIQRITDVLMSLPSILLSIVVLTILGPGLTNAIIAVSVVALPGFIRIARAAALTEKSKPYVIAARSFGAGHFYILFSNVLPNCWAPLIVQATHAFSDGILNVAALGFLGLGAQPPTPEWGTMLADARPFIESAPWLVTLPGLCILLVVLGFNLVGDGLRDAFDPKLKK